MALIQCPDCGSQVSSLSPNCFSCGRPLAIVRKAATRVFSSIFRVVVGVILLSFIGLLAMVFFGYGDDIIVVFRTIFSTKAK